MIYRQRENATATGKVYSDRSRGREAEDELTVRVLRHLRSQNKTFKQALQTMEDATYNGRMISRVAIEQKGDDWTFIKQRKGKPDLVEHFKTSTLQGKKWRKAK